MRHGLKNGLLGREEPNQDHERGRAEGLRQERDRWAMMAEASQRQLVDLTKRPRGLARWFRWGA